MELLIFDFGGTSVKYGIWSQDALIPNSSFPTPKTWEELTTKLLEIKEHYAKDYQLEGAAFSFPGAVDSNNGVIHNISAIPYLAKIPLRENLERLLGLPCSIQNDAKCAALAEIWTGAAKDSENVLFVVIGTGVGGVVILNKKIHFGKHFFGGEFGVMELEPGVTFSAGATAVSMAKRYCEKVGVSEGTYSGQEVFQLAKDGDERATKEVQNFYHYLSLGLYNLQVSYDPDLILIGGGISANTEIIERIRAELNAFFASRNLSYIQPEVRACQYRNEANLIGAVKQFMEDREK